jgi:hypothetical protein
MTHSNDMNNNAENTWKPSELPMNAKGHNGCSDGMVTSHHSRINATMVNNAAIPNLKYLLLLYITSTIQYQYQSVNVTKKKRNRSTYLMVIRVRRSGVASSASAFSCLATNLVAS